MANQPIVAQINGAIIQEPTGFQSVKLPVLNKNKNCLEEYGCDEIYEGDAINIMAYENSYVASLYKLDSPRYLPNGLNGLNGLNV